MFEFITKKPIWTLCDKGYLDELQADKISYQLKTAQDLVCYMYLRDLTGLKIAEIGGGNSRILQRLAINNHCYNIEKFEGVGLGPQKEVCLRNVTNIGAYVGDFSGLLKANQFDIVFSISVVEHVTTDKLDSFFRDFLRILRPGGMFLHAIDMYIEEEPSAYWKERFAIYRSWMHNNSSVEPLGTIYNGTLQFRHEMITNPDNIMYTWNALAPDLRHLREKAQNVSLLIGGKKK